MKSLILTKVNSVNLAFKDQVIELHGSGDKDFLKKFVSFVSPKTASIQDYDKWIDVHTTKNVFKYTIFPNYIMRVDAQTTKKKFFKIS